MSGANGDLGTGYCSAAYAGALSFLGEVQSLPRSGGWYIQRSIPGTERVDAMGPYPLLCCQDWQGLADDLAGLPSALVSFSCVVDPLADVNKEQLADCFPDHLRAMKTHYAIDLTKPLDSFISTHHQRDSRRALRRMETSLCPRPSDYADSWVTLYEENVVSRHAVTGPAAFSQTSLRAQLDVPGLVVFAAKRDDAILGMQLWFVGQAKAYYHLAAYSALGYREGASYALMWQALAHFQDSGVRLINLGGGAGIQAREDDGLTRFKAGWSNMQRTAYFAGRVLNRSDYEMLCRAGGASATDFFPAYRAPAASG